MNFREITLYKTTYNTVKKTISLNFRIYTILFLSLFFLQNNLKAELACSCDPVADSLQLIQLRTMTNGDNWTNIWNTNEPMDDWFGVILTPERCVAQLNLYINFSAYVGNNLTGTLPDLVLPELIDLVLQGNDVSGTLPDFSGLPKLEQLNLNSNEFVGIFPNFAANPNLEIVTMDANSVSGSVPNFPNSPNLRTLSCYFCNLSGTLPAFPNNQELQNIYLGRNAIEGDIPDFDLPQLRILNLNQNELTGDLFDFTGLPLLEELIIGSNNLTGTIPDYQNMPLLRTLEIVGNEIISEIPDFTGMPDLRNLQVGFNPLEGEIPDFSNLPNLKLLDVSRANMTGNLPDFAASPNLEKLGVIGNELEGAVPDYSTKPLVTLRIQENQFDELPDLSALSNWGDFVSNGFVANDNKFTFEDILLNMSAANSGFWRYAPQDSIGEERTEILVPGTDYNIDLEIDENVSDNLYNWYKDGVFLQQNIGANELQLTNLQLSDEGVYTCVVTNAGAPDLTLHSRPITLYLCNQASDAIANNTGVYCTGDAIQLLGNIDISMATDVEYVWTGPNDYNADTQNPIDASEAGIYSFVAILDGCPSLPATTEVQIFQTPAQPIIDPADIVVCEGESLQLMTETVSGIDYEWSGELSFSSNSEDPIVSNTATQNMSGTYFLSLNNNGCLSPEASVNVTVLDVADATFDFLNVCEGETAIPTNVSTTGGVFSFTNPPNDGATINEETGELNNITSPTTYDITYTLNGNTQCPSSSFQSFSVVSAPIIENVMTECAPDLLTYSVTFSTTSNSVSSNLGLLSNMGGDEWKITEIPANTNVEITADNNSIQNCNTTELVIAPVCECPIINAPQVNSIELCEDEENQTLTAIVENDYSANWYNQESEGEILAENTLIFYPPSSGTYFVETYDPLTECVSPNRTAVDFTVFDLPSIEVGNIVCDTLNDAYSVDFYSDSDEITVSEGILTVLLDNNYRVESVRDVANLEIIAINGICESVELIPAPNCYCQRIADLSFVEPSCYDYEDGKIIIEAGTAYSSAVDVFLNGILYQEKITLPTVISGLKSDVYEIELQDIAGCVKKEMINLTQPHELLLDLGEDREITTGDIVEINIENNLFDIAELNWISGMSTLTCLDCLNTIAQPLETTYYQLSLVDEMGCEIVDELRVFVKTDIPVFAPTAFSPNNDGQNDTFTLFGDEAKVTQIDELQIFDRWGNLLFSQTDLAPNDESAGWQGDFKGQDMKNDVYVWIAKVSFFNGKEELLKGSISLLR